MEIFDRLIENPLFFKWIYHPGPEIDSWWETYLKMYPEDAELILLFKKRFEALGFSAEKMSENEKRMLAKQIINSLDSIDRKKERKAYLFELMKYAAIAFIFFSVGAIAVYIKFNQKNQEWVFTETRIPNQLQGPVLILPEGNSIPLKKAESTLDYTNPEKVIVNNESIIKEKKSFDNISNNQLIIPFGNRSKVILNDGTSVWLNAGSRLIYPSKFTGNRREVVLFGEAYFEVAKNKDFPFVVKTSAIEVKVLGTKFNVSAYPEDNVIQTVLIEGGVAIQKNGAGIFDKDLLLSPNQMASFDKVAMDAKVTNVDAGSYIIWTEGLLKFDDLEMCRVLKRLERYYNVHIVYADPSIGSQRITGKLDLNKDLMKVLEYLSKVSSTEFTQMDETNYQIK